ncbi:MAG: RnfABCDGE type electron transport complex subunit G [Nitrospirota bacterium]
MSTKDIIKITLNLVIICALAGVILSVTWAITNPVKLKAEAEELQAALKSLIPQAENIVKVKDITLSGKEGVIYKATANGKTVGYVVQVYTKGYSSFIKLLVAVNPDYKLIGIQVLSEQETPGLGDNVDRKWFKKQFSGKTEDHLVVVKGETNTDIQAISGATISSRAVTNGVKAAVDALRAERAKDKTL